MSCAAVDWFVLELSWKKVHNFLPSRRICKRFSPLDSEKMSLQRILGSEKVRCSIMAQTKVKVKMLFPLRLILAHKKSLWQTDRQVVFEFTMTFEDQLCLVIS